MNPVYPAPPSGSGDTKPLIDQVIDAALMRLKGKVVGLEAREIQNAQRQIDDDHNHTLMIEIEPDVKENASIFALKANGKPKAFETMVQELVLKVENHLSMRDNESLILFPSGAFIASDLNIPIAIQDGYFSVDGKKIVMKAGHQYIPIPAIALNTYTSLTATQEDNLIILSDEHEAVRDDGKEGLIVNLEQVVVLKKEELRQHSKDTNFDALPEEGNYLILYRKREDALKTTL